MPIPPALPLQGLPATEYQIVRYVQYQVVIVEGQTHLREQAPGEFGESGNTDGAPRLPTPHCKVCNA
jgi:hypothetical protein